MITGFIYALGIPLMAGGTWPPFTPEAKATLEQENAQEDAYSHEVLESAIDSVMREEHQWHIRLKPSPYDYTPFLQEIGGCKDLHSAQQALLNAGFFLPEKESVVKDDITADSYNNERAQLADYFLRFLACSKKDLQDDKKTLAEINSLTNAYKNIDTLIKNKKGFGSFFVDSLTGKVLACGMLEAATLYGILRMYAPERSAGLYAALISTVGITAGVAFRALKSKHSVHRKLASIWSAMTAVNAGTFTEVCETSKGPSFLVLPNLNNVTHLTIQALTINLID